MNPPTAREQRQVWAYGIATLLAFLGGVAPIVFAGISSRISGALIPFWIAAILFGISAWYRGPSRAAAISLYFIAGLAVVYAMLQLVSLPLRLTLVGTCTPGPAQCLPGLEPHMTDGEQTGLWFGVGIRLVAIFAGYFGLFNQIRRPHSKAAPPPPVGMIPPVRTIPPVEDTPEEKDSKPAAPAPPTPGKE